MGYLQNPANTPFIPPRGVEPISINTCEQSTNSNIEKTAVQNTVQISAKAQKLELIKQNLDQLSDAQIDAIVNIIFEVRE